MMFKEFQGEIPYGNGCGGIVSVPWRKEVHEGGTLNSNNYSHSSRI